MIDPLEVLLAPQVARARPAPAPTSVKTREPSSGDASIQPFMLAWPV